MKRSFALAAMLSFVAFLALSCSTANRQPQRFYVSPDGNDQWSGKLSRPNSSRTDGPFATLERARDAVRTLKRQRGYPEEGVVVVLRGGIYRLTHTFRLDSSDSGTETHPVIWRAAAGERAVLSGGCTLRHIGPVTDPWARKVIRPECLDKIVEIDLPANGIRDYGQVQKRGSRGLELFYKGKRMPWARYPNEGWLHIADVPQLPGRKPFREPVFGGRRVVAGIPAGRHFGRIRYSGDRPGQWSHENEIFMHGYWTWDWSDSYERVGKIVPKTRTIIIQPPYHRYGYTVNQRFAFYNVLEELDRPGEWVLVRRTGKLYFWPPGKIEDGDLEVSLLEDPLVEIDHARFVRLENLVFRAGRSKGVVIRGGDSVLVAGSTFTCLGGTAALIDGAKRSGLLSCDIHEIGLGGVWITGGDRQTLTPAHNFAVNNHIWNFSQVLGTHQWGIDLVGVGNLAAHNLIHDAPHTAIHFRGNDHCIEYNEIHDVTKETGDAGAIYTGRDYTFRGNVIRYNYLHHLKGPGLHGVTAIYLDDFTSGTTIYGNVLYRAGRAVQIGGGRDNLVENNLFVQCEPSVHVDARGLGWARKYFDGRYNVLWERLKAVPYNKPPYSERYPELVRLPEDDPAVPKNNRIVRNISYGGRWMDVYDFWAFDFSVVTVRDNVIADSVVLRRRAPGLPGPDPYYLDINMRQGYEHLLITDPRVKRLFPDNVFVEGNPGIENFRDFRLSKDCPAWKLGFQRIPFEQIGLQKDAYRQELPERRE
ncbi:MAG: right-handed parallel beta-helix repeat-containing protein [Calditrichaeota bacterium]|nr:right-handed parallel beta-helix repeat-containing protein [Calditrichota bacterium]